MRRTLIKLRKYESTFKRLILVSLLLLLVYYRESIYLSYYSHYYLDTDSVYKAELRNFEGRNFKYNSLCNCRRDTIYLEKTDTEYLVSTSYGKNDDNDTNLKFLKYKIPARKFESSIFLCDMYNVLRRGLNLKVLSYSLYGQNRFYYDNIFEIARLAKKHYPDWIVRIYYDESIDKSIICEIECLKYKKNFNLFLDNVDFCNVEKLPYDTSKVWSASYMHGMTWRWLPIGDSFVDFVGSRDTDAWISQRELDSVHVWMNSSTVFHIMRDAPVHNIPIIGGYWGFANVRNRKLADYFLKVLTNHHVAKYYNKNGKSPKQDDQHLLTRFFAPNIYNSTTHDAFLCTWLGGEPWPSKRPAYYCFVGCSGCCDAIPDSLNKKYDLVCPKECRPTNHQDWIHC